MSAAVAILGAAVLFRDRWHAYFLAGATGDEGGFERSLEVLLQHGWSHALRAGASPLFIGAGAAVSSVIADSLMSLRWVSLISLIATVSAWWLYGVRSLGLRGPYAVLLGLTLLSVGLVRNSYFSAYDDALFGLFISLGFFALVRRSPGISLSLRPAIWGGLAFASALAVRPLLFLYLPGVVAVLFASSLRDGGKVVGWGVAMALSFGLATALLHAPSIIHEGRLSFHEKPTGRAATWVQANYLGLMQGDRTRPSWEEVEGYLDRYGAEALPEGVLEAVTFNWAVTARSVGMRLSESAKPFVRHTGLLAGVFAIFGLMGLLRRSLPPWYIDFAILLAAFGICLSAVAFTGIQFRWYIVFPFMVTVCGVKILQEWEAPRGVGLAILAVNLILLGAANALLVGIW